VTFKPGDTVQLTGQFLRSTRQIAGGEGQLTWKVRECPCRLCAKGQFVCVDERKSEELLRDYSTEEIAANPAVLWRHMNATNLKLVGKPSLRDVY